MNYLNNKPYKMQPKLQPPKNQHALVLHTLICPPDEISIGYWFNEYKSSKFSSRLGELEKDLGDALVFRKSKKFVNRFGHKSKYTVYIPILSKEQYIEFYNKINN